jgi:hypothetical protein
MFRTNKSDYLLPHRNDDGTEKMALSLLVMSRPDGIQN